GSVRPARSAPARPVPAGWPGPGGCGRRRAAPPAPGRWATPAPPPRRPPGWRPAAGHGGSAGAGGPGSRAGLPGPGSGRPGQAVAQLAGVAPADRQLVAGHHEVVAAAVAAADLGDVADGDQVPPVDPDKPGVAPRLLQRGDRHPHEEGAVVGVEADVIAAGLNE